MKVLVAYASKYGSTNEVAESIGAVMREQFLATDVRPAGEVDDLDEYDAVVLGGGIYVGRWHRDARGFAKHFADELSRMPVAIFALGPVDDVPDHREGSEKQFRSAVEKLSFQPVASALFGGAVDPRRLPFPFNHMPAADVRDWGAIRAWSLVVADAFASAALPI